MVEDIQRELVLFDQREYPYQTSDTRRRAKLAVRVEALVYRDAVAWSYREQRRSEYEGKGAAGAPDTELECG
jgi:hypothetical protein